MSHNNETRRSERTIVHVESELEYLIPRFLEAWKEEVRSMREALENNEYGTIRMLGHNMKGTGGSCGLEVITDIGRSIEEAAKAMDPGAIRKNLDTLLSYLERVEFVYE